MEEIYKDRVNKDGYYVQQYTVDGKRKNTRLYNLWDSLSKRSNPTRKFLERFPSYEGCENKFTTFQSFAVWCVSQDGYTEVDSNNKVWHLDKDVLYPGNKIYSPTTCCFVPEEVNCALTYCTQARGDFPLGVYSRKLKSGKTVYRSTTRIAGERVNVGPFTTAELAHRHWQLSKIEAFVTLREKYSEYPNIFAGLSRHIESIYTDYNNHTTTIR